MDQCCETKATELAAIRLRQGRVLVAVLAVPAPCSAQGARDAPIIREIQFRGLSRLGDGEAQSRDLEHADVVALIAKDDQGVRFEVAAREQVLNSLRFGCAR